VARGNSWYDSFQGKITKRYSQGLTVLASYTYAKSLDVSSGIRVQGDDTLFPLNSYCVKCEYGLSAFDTRHRFVTSGLWDLPIGKGKHVNIANKFANAAVGDWQVGSIVTLQSGFPITPNIGGTDRSGTGGGFDRPNATGISTKLDNPTTGQWFNIEAFALNAAGTFGNAGRDVVNGPGIASWDFSTLKNFKFTERRYLQFRFEAFNAANHPSWGDPGVNLNANRLTAAGVPIPGAGAFGQITTTRSGIDMRELQFSLKLIF
jgi:hypothetical protein